MVDSQGAGARMRAARIVGVLMLTATATYLIGSELINSVMTAPDYLARAHSERSRVIAGVLLEYIDAIAVLGIGIVLYPILIRHNRAIALGYAGARIIESLLLLIAGIGTLAMLTLSREYVAAGASDASAYDLAGTLLISQSDLAFQAAMLVLGLGSIPFCYLLYRTELVPRYLALLGLVGYVFLTTSAVLELSGVGTGMVLYLPGALFELIFPIRLIVRGFNAPEQADLTERNIAAGEAPSISGATSGPAV